MMPLHKTAGITLRTIVAGSCCLGIWNSFQLTRADWYFRQDTVESIQKAVGLLPDGWRYYMRLAQFERAKARELLTTSLRLNRYNAQADIELGLQYEADGDYERAQQQLLQAYDIDRTYLPRWTLANYYFRRGNMQEFWVWARSAAAIPADDVGGLLDLCWRISSDPQMMIDGLVNDDPKLLRQLVGFLSSKEQSRPTASVALRLIRFGDPISDRPLMLETVNKLIAANDGAAAMDLWHRLIKQGWVTADLAVINNASFGREPLPVSFDWLLPEYNGLHSWPGPSGLDSEFSGSEPEVCTVAEQIVTLSPGKYSMSFSYRTTNIPSDTGLRWQVLDAKSSAILGESKDISSPELKYSGFGFIVPEGTPLQRVRLLYRRSLGTPRISGTMNVVSTQIQAISN
jgi:hypothetical protein